MDQIKQKINLSVQIKKSIDEEDTIDNIDQQLTLAEAHVLDSSLIHDLRQKKDQVSQLRQHALIFTSKKEFHESDLRKIYTILYESRRVNTEFQERKYLMEVMKGFSWVVRLHGLVDSVLKNTFSTQKSNSSINDSDIENVGFDIRSSRIADIFQPGLDDKVAFLKNPSTVTKFKSQLTKC
mmetsp:Transcript_33123/g.30031  ORF Transcript_33123/g.30031 Transcript_33123/m.30031 type:complete len:181 (+) Transcript_33123:1080-1622(+)